MDSNRKWNKGYIQQEALDCGNSGTTARLMLGAVVQIQFFVHLLAINH